MTDDLEQQERERVLEAISPTCVGVLTKVDDQEVICGHKLRRHDPCSECVCPGFVDAEGRGAGEASAALIAAHRELFPEVAP